MAFANLFTRLSAVEEGVKSLGQPAFTHRDDTDDGKRDNARKRKSQVEHSGPYEKKQHYRAQTTRSYNATKEQKNKHQQKERWRPANRGGSHQTRPTWRKDRGDSRNKNYKQDIKVERPKFMTQEFKDNNALLVDGRLVCRHFLWGRCIKADDCKLEHIQGYNDLVKEVCKFYVQGLCTKGESCPYMHNSFPCKFFYRGHCSQGADCRFSHEPLNDVTSQLLSEVTQRDLDLYEKQQQLAKKPEKESSGQPENTDESEVMEANRTPDTHLLPLRPNFYNSTETNAVKETLLCQTEELADNMEEAVPPHASHTAQPHIPPSSNLNHEEPVCYSVAAVLGPQLSKPFPNFFTTPGSQDSGPLSSPDCTSRSSNQSDAPYSVDAVLRSCRSVEKSTFGHTSIPPTAQTVTYTPKTDSEDITDPLLSTETQNEKVLYSVKTRNEVKKSQEFFFKSLSSLQVYTGPIPNTCLSQTLPSGDYKKQGGSMPESLKPAQKARSMHLPMDITRSLNSKSEGVLPFGHTNSQKKISRPHSQTSTSKHPTHLRPHLSVLTSDSQASIKPFCPSSGDTDFKGGAAVPVEPVTTSSNTCDSANSFTHHFAEKQPTEIHLHAKKTQSGLKHGTQHYSTKITAECSSKMAHCGDVAVGCKKTLKRPFHSLFASPITDTLQPSCPQASCPAPQPADCTSNCVESAVEPASAKSFSSLFAASLPCMQSRPDNSRTSSCSRQSEQSVDNTPHSSNSKQRPSNLERPLPHQVRTNVKEISHAPTSPNFSPNPKIENEDCSAEHVNQPTQQLVNPVCSLVSDSLSEMSTSPTPCGNSPSTTRAPQQLPDISSHKGSVAATANSVLKTLFLCLSPYQQDREQHISVPSDSQSNSPHRKQLHTQQTTNPLFRLHEFH